MRQTYIDVTLPQLLTMLEKLLKANNNGDGYFVGDDVSRKQLIFKI